MLQKFFQFFVPKDKIFFNLFEQVAINSDEMGKKLCDLVYEPDAHKRSSILAEIEKLEHDNDSLTHELFIELGKNFITPLDREDIHYLASALDDVADFIYLCAKRIVFYKINPNDTGIQKLAELIKQSAEQTRIMIMELKHLKKMNVIADAIIKINSIENQADDIYDMSIEHLFEIETDFKEVIKKREIYHNLESVTDKCEDVSNVVETILIKYA